MSLAALLAPALAHAHPGHAQDASFAAGALHPLTGVDHLLLLALAGALASRLAARALRVLGAVFIGLIGAGAAGDSGAWTYAAGFLLTSASLIFITRAAVAALVNAPRHLIAAARRSPTSAAESAPAHRPSAWR